jgi:hypothetical protein
MVPDSDALGYIVARLESQEIAGIKNLGVCMALYLKER